jgi:hypothetical protein
MTATRCSGTPRTSTWCNRRRCAPQFKAAGTLIREPLDPAAARLNLLYFLYATITMIDGLYIYLHRQRRKAIARERAAVPAAVTT